MADLKSFDAIEHDDETTRTLGVVTMDAQGMLAIVSLQPDDSDQLQTVVDELNAEDTLHEEAVPPAGARPFEVFTRPVPRGTEGFVPALLDHLQRYHGIELRQR